MDDRNNTSAARSFAKALAGALSASLAQVAGSAWRLDVTGNQEPPVRDAQPLQFRIKVEGGLRGDCFVEFYEPQLSHLLAKLSGGEVEKQAGMDAAKALGALLSSATVNLRTALAAQFGELAFKVEAVSGLAFGGMFVVPLAVHADDTSSPSVVLYFDGALIEALSAASAGQQQTGAGKGQFHADNLRLVMDVELNVSLRFGQRQLPLREVLELTNGSVIELDRMVDEPVEMLLDGKVIARGEAVIVDGNYGLRVTEISQPIEEHLLRS